jgi:hypothetical protein
MDGPLVGAEMVTLPVDLVLNIELSPVSAKGLGLFSPTVSTTPLDGAKGHPAIGPDAGIVERGPGNFLVIAIP